MMSMNPMAVSGSMSRFYVPPQGLSGPFNAPTTNTSSSFMNITGGGNSNFNQSIEDINNISTKNTSKSSRNPPQNNSNNPMSILTSRPGINNPNLNPSMLSPGAQQQLFNSHQQQQILNSGFSPAVIAAATSALSSTNPQFSQLIQHQLHLQQQQLSHLQLFQTQMQQQQTNENKVTVSSTKEPKCDGTGGSPIIITKNLLTSLSLSSSPKQMMMQQGQQQQFM